MQDNSRFEDYVLAELVKQERTLKEIKNYLESKPFSDQLAEEAAKLVESQDKRLALHADQVLASSKQAFINYGTIAWAIFSLLIIGVCWATWSAVLGDLVDNVVKAEVLEWKLEEAEQQLNKIKQSKTPTLLQERK
jgi:DNA-binding transcriptional MerR regulator